MPDNIYHLSYTIPLFTTNLTVSAGSSGKQMELSWGTMPVKDKRVEKVGLGRTSSEHTEGLTLIKCQVGQGESH